MESASSQPAAAPRKGVFGRFFGPILMLVDGRYVDRAACDRACERMHKRDSIGDRIHLILACFGLVCLFGPATMTEIGFAPLLVFFVVRVFNTFPVWIHGFGQPTVLLAIAISIWMMISLSWSSNPELGWEEIAQLRWFLLVGLIFPVIDRRVVLIIAMCVGVLFGQLGQLIDGFDGFGNPWLGSLVYHTPNRISGWWHPVVAGSILVSAIGFFVPMAVFGRRRIRGLGLVGSSAVITGLIATNSRGGWIAGVMMIGVVCALGVWMRGRLGNGRALKRGGSMFGLVVGLVLVVIAGSGWVMRGRLMDRIEETRGELREIADGRLDSLTGVRVMMAQRAVDAGLAHPIGGVGAGGFQDWANQTSEEKLAHAHAHNSVLQIWSTLGLVGLGLWGMLVWTMLRGGYRIWDPASEGIVGLVPMVGIIGLVLASITDSVHLSMQSAAMLGALAALCPAYRPGHPRWRTEE